MWRNSFPKLFCELIGAFVVWSIKGFKGKYVDEIAGPYDLGTKSTRNFLITGAIFIVVILIALEYEKKQERNDNIIHITIEK
ncbi:hypothetical protein [Carboxylicivirga marina]|uniref:Uncharacterized protein n=1 Tax=Carboxylicivirga marina TaxID=2800988 RepID=A0ABS1HQN2_9BACT|nr:hypothetical protein [Carboxylicivirga marina]MBK3519795.1 hypothetical protein [Carboxylicivirga marina]